MNQTVFEVASRMLFILQTSNLFETLFRPTIIPQHSKALFVKQLANIVLATVPVVTYKDATITPVVTPIVSATQLLPPLLDQIIGKWRGHDE